MEALIIQVRKIEAYFKNANYEETYEAFHRLCQQHPDFCDEAMMILSRYNDYSNDVINGVLDPSTKTLRKQEIASAFHLCIKRFKKWHLQEYQSLSYIEEEAFSIKENRHKMWQTKKRIEENSIHCWNDDKKRTLFEKIIAEISKILERFDSLLTHFAEILNYERSSQRES